MLLDIVRENVDYPTKLEEISMKQPVDDPRVVRTKTLLRSSLMELAAEKSYASLSVQDVTEHAGLNRTTFYLHYKGMHELLEDCVHTLFTELHEQVLPENTSIRGMDSLQTEHLVTSAFEHLAAHKEFYCAMLGKHGDPYFRARFQELLAELIFEPIARQSPGFSKDQRFEITLQFFSAGFIGMAAWWLEKDMPLTPSEAARQVTRDILPDYLRLLTKNQISQEK
jgi:AcrR family transcriptional regulator